MKTWTHTVGPLQTHTSWCAQTGRWGWAAAPQSHSWCSGWRSSSGHGTAWTSPVLASPAASPGPPPRSQRTSEARLWPALSRTSSLFWETGGDARPEERAQDESVYFMDHGAYAGDSVCLPGVQRVSEDVQAAHHHCRVTSCERNSHCRRATWFKAKEAHEHTDRGNNNLTKERNPVSDKSCQLTEQAGKERR